MHIFIDESGNFLPGRGPESVSLVGAIIVPDSKRRALEQRYLRLRPRLLRPKFREVKGSALDEAQIAIVIDLLLRNDVIFEAIAIDVAAHRPETIIAFRKKQSFAITANLDQRYSSELVKNIWNLRRKIEVMQPQLFVQAIVLVELVASALQHGTMYHSLRRPRELGSFQWVFDAKGSDGPAPHEEVWRTLIMPWLQSLSLTEPIGFFERGDYSYLPQMQTPEYLVDAAKLAEGSSGVDLQAIFGRRVRFSARAEPGLELVDILVNALRRAFTGRLRPEGFGRLSSLMIHQRQQYVRLIQLGESGPRAVASYDAMLRRFFMRGGRQMAPDHRIRAT